MQLLLHLPAFFVTALYHNPLLVGDRQQQVLSGACICCFCIYAHAKPDLHVLARCMLLQPLVQLLSHWPSLLLPSERLRLPPWVSGESGPFGKNAGKLLELGVCVLLGRPFLRLGTLTPSIRGAHGDWMAMAVVVGCGSVVVAAVLYAWSWLTRSRGLHHGVNAMRDQQACATAAAADHQRSEDSGVVMLLRQHTTLIMFAFTNALCEEVVARGLFLGALAALYGPYSPPPELAKADGTTAASVLALMSDMPLVLAVGRSCVVWVPNTCQAIGFGIAHWHGVPSGPSGVALTFVYGLLMGSLHQWSGGLLLPVLCHGVADYFIFAVIAMSQQQAAVGIFLRRREPKDD
jgi:membrane protease YdiL (CAAX protease family)